MRRVSVETHPTFVDTLEMGGDPVAMDLVPLEAIPFRLGIVRNDGRDAARCVQHANSVHVTVIGEGAAREGMTLLHIPAHCADNIEGVHR